MPNLHAKLAELAGHLSNPSAYQQIGRATALRMLFDMTIVRAFEQQLLDCSARGEVTGPVHSSIGQEGVAAAVLHHLRQGDHVIGNHRSHHHFVVQSLARTVDADFDPLTDHFPVGARSVLAEALAEILGMTSGVNNGAGGSMHLRNESIGFMGSSAIVGGGVPIAAGIALANSLRRTDACAVCFIGDGAVNQGTFHETANLAGVLGLPLLLVVENNGYAEATRPEEASALLPLATQGAAHGLAAQTVDGADLAALYAATERCIASLREGGGPAMLEVETYRHLDHAGGLPGSAAEYRSPEEEAVWLRRDPLASLPHILAEAGLLHPGEHRRISEAAAAAVRDAYGVAKAFDKTTPALEPYALLRSPVVLPRPDFASHVNGRNGTSSVWTFKDAIAKGIAGALRRSQDVVFLGEEVANPGGLLSQGGCLDEELVGTRIVNTPISEASFVGMAGGAAMAGLRPIVELMYGSFALIAADQLFNHIGVIRALYGNTAKAPVIVRAKVPTGLGYGPQHGLNPVGLFNSFPGWRVYAPADARDYIGTLNSALRSEDPVLLVEFSPLYSQPNTLTEKDFEHFSPLEGARVVRPGDDLSIFTYGLGVAWARTAADTLATGRVSAEIVDLRALDMVSMDWTSIEQSLSRTGRGLFVDPAARGQAIGPKLIGELINRDNVQARLSYIACADVQPVAPLLERQAVISGSDVEHAARQLLQRDPVPSTVRL